MLPEVIELAVMLVIACLLVSPGGMRVGLMNGVLGERDIVGETARYP